jgi:DNA-binding FadR family transcriptional regulator
MTTIEVIKPDPEETKSGAARVLTFFRDRLLSGELKAGDRLLPERELAAALDVSRPVLREALRSLAMLGLLDIQHGRGAFVKSADASVLGQALTLCLAPEPNILNDVLQARIAIECQAIRLACERASERDLQAIAVTLDTLVDSLDDPERGGSADYAFHLAIVRASGSASLMKIYEAISPLLMRSHVERRRDTFREPAITAGLVDAHRRVFLSLANRDPDAAEAGLRDHFAIGDELRRRSLISADQPPAHQPPTHQSKRKRS